MRRHATHTVRLLLTIAGVAVAVAVGLAVGLLGGAAASTAVGHNDTSPIPSRQRLAAAAAALTHTTRSASSGTLVAQARRRTIPLYHRHGKHPYRTLSPLPYSYGTRPVFRVLGRKHAWLHVSLPVRPNHSSAWIRRRDVALGITDYRVEVEQHRHRLVLWRGSHRIVRTPIAVGKALTPTPTGTYFIAYVLRTGDPSGFFGPYAFGLSAYSNVLTRFAGGDGEVGMHGTSEPWLLGKSVSHGCIRIRNAVISRLAHLLPLGTPVQIER
ncbi:MAG TPA: L,D-transpeptidase [Gaiellaceae bacterium]